MFNKFKSNLAHFIIRTKYLKRNHLSINFNGKITNCIYLIIIMPNDENDFRNSVELVRYFLIHRKNITLVLPEHRVNLIGEKEKFNFITYGLPDITRLKLPSKELKRKVKSKEYDLLIDLNYKEDTFLSALSVLIKAGLKVGFCNSKNELYYGLQFSYSSLIPETIYRNYLNFLRMF